MFFIFEENENKKDNILSSVNNSWDETYIPKVGEYCRRTKTTNLPPLTKTYLIAIDLKNNKIIKDSKFCHELFDKYFDKEYREYNISLERHPRKDLNFEFCKSSFIGKSISEEYELAMIESIKRQYSYNKSCNNYRWIYLCADICNDFIKNINTIYSFIGEDK